MKRCYGLYLSFISEFTTDLQYLPGPANVVADALSRPAPVAALVADSKAMKRSRPRAKQLVSAAAAVTIADGRIAGQAKDWPVIGWSARSITTISPSPSS